jgi:PAS domain S-box-containing protein
MLLTVVLFYHIRSMEQDKAKVAFDRAARERFDELQSDLQLSILRVNALGAFCESNYPVTRASFDSFGGSLINDTAIQALEWMPEVPLSARKSTEQAARSAGLSDFEIRDHLGHGEMVRAANRPVYFPVLWVVPYAGNELALGFDDLASDPRRIEALQSSAETGQLVATKSITLIQEKGNQYGILLFHPVIHYSPKRQLLGFVVGVLRVGSVVEKHGAASGIALTVTESGPGDEGHQLYPIGVEAPMRTSGVMERRQISVGGRQWVLTATPVAGAFPVSQMYAYLGAGLALFSTLLIVAYLWASSDRREKVKRLVEERTAALNSALNSLAEVHRDLEENEVRYRSLVEDSPNAIFVERQGKIVLANRNAVNMFAFDPVRDSANHTLLDFVAPERREPAREVVRRLYARDMQVAPTETRLQRMDGTIMDAEVAASSFVANGERSIQVTVRDISQKKRDQAENARLIHAIEQAAESIVITDVDANIVYVNPAFERVTGYSREEAMGKNPRILKSGTQSVEFYAALWEKIKAGESWTGQFLNRAKSGRFYREEASISPVADPSGQVISYVAVKRDITHEYELQEQLLQARKMDAIGRLAGGVAHDFNNMLMVMTSYAELLASDLPQEDRRRGFTDQILRAAERSSALTRQLLAFSRKQVLAPRVIDCNAILSETSSMVRRLIAENIEFKCDLAPDLWHVKADADQIVQVILNLCVNSRDAMPNGGTLTLSSSNYPLNGGFVELSVVDTGIGISEELQEKLFEPFFTTKEMGKGTGLGLSTVYGIVQQSGGYIRVESELGKGAAFRIYLPRCESVALAAEEAAQALPQVSAGLVLIVEDEAALRSAIAEQLRSHGFKVMTAADGAEALDVLSNNQQVSTLITDLVMPRMGGENLCGAPPS